jgi:hypothetical protein
VIHIAASEAVSLAIAASLLKRWPFSNSPSPGRAQGQQRGGVELALHVGDLGLGHLEGADRRAEALRSFT